MPLQLCALVLPLLFAATSIEIGGGYQCRNSVIVTKKGKISRLSATKKGLDAQVRTLNAELTKEKQKKSKVARARQKILTDTINDLKNAKLFAAQCVAGVLQPREAPLWRTMVGNFNSGYQLSLFPTNAFLTSGELSLSTTFKHNRFKGALTFRSGLLASVFGTATARFDFSTLHVTFPLVRQNISTPLGPLTIIFLQSPQPEIQLYLRIPTGTFTGATLALTGPLPHLTLRLSSGPTIFAEGTT